MTQRYYPHEDDYADLPGDVAKLQLYLREVIGRLEVISQENAALKIQVAGVNSRVENTESSVKELVRTVRGFNGTAGLVTEVALLKETMCRCFEDTANSAAASKSAEESKKELEDHKRDAEDDFVSWKWVRDKLGLPIILGFLTWFLLTILPRILEHLGGN